MKKVFADSVRSHRCGGAARCGAGEAARHSCPASRDQRPSRAPRPEHSGSIQVVAAIPSGTMPGPDRLDAKTVPAGGIAYLATHIKSMRRRHPHSFTFGPATIGASPLVTSGLAPIMSPAPTVNEWGCRHPLDMRGQIRDPAGRDGLLRPAGLHPGIVPDGIAATDLDAAGSVRGEVPVKVVDREQLDMSVGPLRRRRSGQRRHNDESEQSREDLLHRFPLLCPSRLPAADAVSPGILAEQATPSGSVHCVAGLLSRACPG